MPSEAYWKRRYERAEAERVQAVNELRDLTLKMIDVAADEQQQQIDALEKLLLNRATLVGIKLDGRKIRFTFTRRGQMFQCEAYGAMDMPVAQWRKELLDA